MIKTSDAFVNVNGEIYEADMVPITSDNGALQYGYGLFETLRTYSSVFFAWSEHYQRMVLGCRALHMEIPFTEEQGLAQLKTLQQYYREQSQNFKVATGEVDEDAVYRITVMPAAIKNWSLGASMYIITRRAVPNLRTCQEQGIAAVVLTTPRLPSATGVRVKGISFVDIVLARQEMQLLSRLVEQPFAEGLMLDRTGKVIEATCSNVFLVIHNDDAKPVLLTPPEADGPLLGVTRKQVIQIAIELGISVIERSVWIENIEQAEEIFVTNSVQEIVPVTAVMKDRQWIYRAKNQTATITHAILKSYKQSIIINRK